ncbi:unnamed protein product [Sphacelaria rigidula]
MFAVGIGCRTALHLANMGATVVMACRSVEKGDATRALLEKEIKCVLQESADNGGPASAGVLGPARGGTLRVMKLDLADLESVRAFAKEFKAKHTRLDVLVNNAGLGYSKVPTADGLDMVFGVNFVGHFALSLELMPLIESTPQARVVCLASVLHHFGGTHWEGAMAGHKGYINRDAYPDSKLAMVLFAKELRRRFAASGSTATAFAVNPGAVRSDIWRSTPSIIMPIYDAWMRMFFLNIEEGCRPSVCASALPLESLSGDDYYQPYWLPFGRNIPAEILGVYAGCAPAKPSLPKDEPAASGALWTACENVLKTTAAARREVR